MVPHGFKFNPTDEELVEVLDRKASGNEMPLHFIVETNVYHHEPQDLEWNQTTAFSNDERYYYCRRETESREVLGLGWWKATSHVKKVYVNEHIVGLKRPLTFHRFNNNDRNRNNAVKTNWIMHEYGLESSVTDWRLCKIKYKGKSNLQEEMKNFRRSCSSRKDFEAGGSNSTNLDSLGGTDHQQQPLENSFHIQSHHNEQFNMPLPSYDNDLSQLQPSNITNLYYFYEQPENNEEPFPSLWSWEN